MKTGYKHFAGLAGLAALLVCGQAAAEGMKSGWSLSAFGDPFTKQTALLAAINETSESAVNLNEATLGFTCTKAIFRSQRFSFGTKAEKVSFRIGAEIVEAVFEPIDTEIGSQFALDGPVADKLRAGLMTEAPVGFQTSDKTGEFSAIGASKILAALDGACKAGS